MAKSAERVKWFRGNGSGLTRKLLNICRHNKEGFYITMNEKVINAISSLEQEVLKTLIDGPLKPEHIASILGTEVISKRPDGKPTGIANPIITGILWGLEKRSLAKQSSPYDSWEITDSGKEYIRG